MVIAATFLRNYGIRAYRAILFAHERFYMEGKRERVSKIYRRLVVMGTNFLEKHDLDKKDEKIVKQLRAHAKKIVKCLEDMDKCEEKYYEHMEKAQTLAKHWGKGAIKKAGEKDSYEGFA